MSADMESRLAALENERAEFRVAVRDIRDLSERQARSLESLVRLEERHADYREALNRAFSTLKEHNGRMSEIEHEMPSLRRARDLALKAVIAIVAVVGMALVGMVVVKPAPPQIVYPGAPYEMSAADRRPR